MKGKGRRQTEEHLLREIGLHLQSSGSDDETQGRSAPNELRSQLIELRVQLIDEARSDKPQPKADDQGELFDFVGEDEVSLCENSGEPPRSETVGNEMQVQAAQTPLDPVARARSFLSARYEQIHHALCHDREKRKELLASDEASLVTAITDIIVGLPLGVPAITLARLLASIGLKRLCKANPFATDHARSIKASRNP